MVYSPGRHHNIDYSHYTYKLIDPEIITPYSYTSFLGSVADRYSNHKEWQAINEDYLHVDDIDFLLDKTPLNYLEEKRNTASDPVVKAIYQYIIFTRDVATYVTYDASRRWEYSRDRNKPERKQKIEELITLSQERAEESGKLSPFLRFRYNFQALRLASMLNQHELVEEIYQKKIAPNKTGSIVRYWAQGYYARAQLNLNRPVDALLTYAAIYDQCPPMMETALRSIRYIKRENFKSALARIENSKHRQATVRLLESLSRTRDYSADSLKKLIELEPKADRAEYLLSRIFITLNDYNSIGDIINLVKQDISLRRYTGLVEVCRERADYWRAAQQADRGGLWSIFGAYLALLDGDNDSATALLTGIEPDRLNDQAIKMALRQVWSLAAIAEASADNHSLSDADLTEIAMLMRDMKDVRSINSWRLLLAEYFNQKNDLVRILACLRFVDSDNQVWLDPTVIGLGFATEALKLLGDEEWQRLEDFVEGKKLSPFDRYLLDNFLDLSLPAIIYRRGRMYQANGEHEKAIEQFNRLGEEFWSTEQEELDHRLVIPKGQNSIQTMVRQFEVTEESSLVKKEPEVKVLNARQYSQYMIKMQDELNRVSEMTPEEVQKLYFRLGNLEYYQFAKNFPGHGRLLTQRKPKRDFVEVHMNKKPLNPAVLLRIYKDTNWAEAPSLVCDKSLEYYNKAIEIDADPEITAQCLIMASASKNVFLYVNLKPDNPALADGLKFHRKLAANYQGTRFYQEYLKECPLLKMFQ